MTTRKPLVALLKRHDAELRQASPEPRLQARLHRSLAAVSGAGAQRTSGWLLASALAAIALCGVVLVRTRVVVPIADQSQNTASEFRTANNPEACTQRETPEGLELTGRCSLQVGPIQLSTHAVAVVALRTSSVDVVRGRVDFSVTPVPVGQPPVRIGLPGGGVIEVLGTKFSVDQGRDSGRVVLSEGTIQLTYKGQSPVVMRPGDVQVLRGALPPSESSSPPPEPVATDASARATQSPPLRSGPPQPLPTAAAKSVDVPPGAIVDDQIARALALRASGQSGAALAALDALNGQELEPHTAEVLSYERADIVKHSGDLPAACKLWRTHLERFPGGSYQAAVQTRLQRDCTTE